VDFVWKYSAPPKKVNRQRLVTRIVFLFFRKNGMKNKGTAPAARIAGGGNHKEPSKIPATHAMQR
jgi:hypothetical protein